MASMHNKGDHHDVQTGAVRMRMLLALKPVDGHR